jgi:hypothetical protein
VLPVMPATCCEDSRDARFALLRVDVLASGDGRDGRGARACGGITEGVFGRWRLMDKRWQLLIQ